jgi:hypothetical protein
MDARNFEQMLAVLQQQSMASTMQMQAFMQQTNAQFMQMMLNMQGPSRRKDAPMYEGKQNEDIELWFFSTEDYYSKKRGLMEADSSEFVEEISCNLGKSVLNWYRTVFTVECTAEGVPKTWRRFKEKLRQRFKPADFEYDLRERMHGLRQTSTIQEYTTKFQDMLSQAELPIGDLDQRFYFQSGLRAETQAKIKEDSPQSLDETIKIAITYETAHYGKTTKGQKGSSKSVETSDSSKFKGKKDQKKSQGTPKSKNSDDWKKSKTCHNCGQKGHISPDCPDKKKESNHYMTGGLYASLEVPALAYLEPRRKKNVTIFIDNGSSLNGISDDLAQSLNLHVIEDVDNPVEVKLGFDQTVLRPRRMAEMTLEVPSFPTMTTNFQVMPIPEGNDVMLGMIWLREHNPEIDWKTLKLSPRSETQLDPPLLLRSPSVRPARLVANRRHSRTSQSREIFNYYRLHGHDGQFGHTKFISMKKLAKEMRKGGAECVFVINPHDSEKAARFKQQGWDALRSNPAFEVLWKRCDTVFRTELPNTVPPVREGIEHVIELKPGTQPIHVPQWRQSPEQRKVIQEWTKEMVKAGIIRPSTSPFSAPTFCVKKPVGWRIVHDFRQLNSHTVLPAIPMPRKEDTFDAMSGSHWFSCMDLLWGYYQVKLREQDIPFTAFSTPDGLFEYLVTPMGLSGSPGTFNRLLQRVFSDMRDCMRVYFDDIYVFTRSTDIQEHLEALDRVLERCEEQQLYIKLSKCQFCVPEIPCLGDFVGRSGVRMDPDKVKAITDWPVPKTKRQMESFLGTTVYVSRFCPDFAQFAGPLHECIKGKRSGDSILLSDQQLSCFEILKSRLSSPPVLRLPDFSKPFGIRMDASNFAIGGVLFQKEGGMEHPIAYTSRKMK